ncbi:hypothetical protein A0H81_06185 [Grifola frondosa]|uniref:Cytochrome P450 n=1 Tax=Grifola frondosa TaxID=5627 RepID=A0A1C7MB87_GRIFR|nr:hypothetical protein A0H81_06185 [Grifola frondosa]
MKERLDMHKDGVKHAGQISRFACAILPSGGYIICSKVSFKGMSVCHSKLSLREFVDADNFQHPIILGETTFTLSLFAKRFRSVFFVLVAISKFVARFKPNALTRARRGLAAQIDDRQRYYWEHVHSHAGMAGQGGTNATKDAGEAVLSCRCGQRVSLPFAWAALRLLGLTDAMIGGELIPAGTVENSQDLETYLVPFSTGPRSCLGINLAWCELYLNMFRKVDMTLYNKTHLASKIPHLGRI